jgi:hypothetical protein
VGLSAGLLLGAVPRVIGQAYRGESLPVLNAMIRGQAVSPVDHYLSVWRDVALRILAVEAAIGLLLVLLSFPPLQRAIDRRLGSAACASGMSRRQVIAASLIVLALAGLQLFDILFQREDWPFSSYPMYAARQGDHIAWLRVYGVAHSGELALIPELYLRPLDTARLNYSFSREILSREDRAAATERALRSLYGLYEGGRRARDHEGPAVHTLRLYQERWRILPSLVNRSAPDERRLLFELRVAD